MLMAAHEAGKAINIAQTTAGHAMCYKLSGLFGITHGHAAALCVRKLWPYMLKNISKTRDPRGEEHLRGIFNKLADVMGCSNAKDAPEVFNSFFNGLSLSVPTPSREDFQLLTTSVNPERLSNNPVPLDAESLDNLYRDILSED